MNHGGAQTTELNDISGEVMDAALKVHSSLCPGLLENVYQACLKHELTKRKLKAFVEVGMPDKYDGICLDPGYRMDLLVEDKVIIELKAQHSLTPLHRSQLFADLKLSGKPLGLLIKFGQRHLKNGIHRIAN